MFSVFEAYIHSMQTNLTAHDLVLVRDRVIERKVRRRQLLLKEGEVSRHKIFVAKGLLRMYYVRPDGTEHILRFAPENTWIMDHESYLYDRPSKYTIEALEDSEVLMWSKEELEHLLATVPAFKAFSDKVMVNTLHANHERILMNISYTSEEKYADFVASFPDVFRRVPLHMVAAYLGVSRETLSRIRARDSA